MVVECKGKMQGEYWYKVNLGGRRKACPEKDLELCEGELEPLQALLEGKFGSKENFSRLITYTKLATSIRNNIYALFNSKTEFHAYQYKPLLKFLDSENQRLLIADEVGLGKTIEAGLILIEQRARNPLDRVLVICPAALAGKWREEMVIRFDEDFEILDADRLHQFFNDFRRDGHNTQLKGIISLQSLRSRNNLEVLEALGPHLDLVIIDEAHHMRNPETLSNRLGHEISKDADSLLLLTATPVHLGSQDLFNLVRILHPEEYDNLYLFDQRLEKNKHVINAERELIKNPPEIKASIAELQNLQSKDPERYEDHTIFNDVIRRLEEFDPSDRRDLVQLQHDIKSLDMLSHTLTRTRKREVQKAAVRKANVADHEFTSLERRFYDAVTNFIRKRYEEYTSNGFWLFVAMSYQRQVASCIPAMIKRLKERFDLKTGSEVELIDESDFVQEEWTNGYDGGIPSTPEEELSSVINTIEQREFEDTKYKRLLELLRGLDQEQPNKKIVLFSYFKGTLNYLSEHLSGDGYSNVVIHGDYSRDDRDRNIKRFRDDSSVRLLLSSEVGSEGLDFQFCHILINYDLPWNPMKVEQRIGRLDRFGQTSDKISIFNVVSRGTIEEKILSRLYKRIQIFKSSIGDLEPILGQKIHELTKDLLSNKLTESEESERIEQIARAVAKERQEQERLEKEGAKLLGFDEYFQQEMDRITRYKNYISGDQLRVFLEDYLESNHPRIRLQTTQRTEVYKLKMNQDLLQSIQSNIIQDDPAMRKLRSAFYGNNGEIELTFDSETANRDKGLIFINNNHPVIRNIVHYYSSHRNDLYPVSKIQIHTDNFHEGLYFYFVFLLEFSGARSEKRLEYIVINSQSFETYTGDQAEAFLGILYEKGETPVASIENETTTSSRMEAKDIAEETIHRLRASKEAELRRVNDSLIDDRIASLNKSYDYKIGRARCPHRQEAADQERRHAAAAYR